MKYYSFRIIFITIFIIFPLAICLFSSLILQQESFIALYSGALFTIIFLCFAPFIMIQQLWQIILIIIFGYGILIILTHRYTTKKWQGLIYNLLIISWLFFAMIYAMPYIIV